MYRIKDEDVIKACKNAESMSKAAQLLGIHLNTLRSRAKKLGCYDKNQSGRGMRKNKPFGEFKFRTEDILAGKHPQYKSNKLKIRLLTEGYKENVCEQCGCGDNWNGKPITLELDHVDGNSYNHSLDNLQILCPNCHSQTPNHRFKGRTHKSNL